jgi:hypothetical protein
VFLGANTTNKQKSFPVVARHVHGIYAPWDSAPVSVDGVWLGGWYVACGGGGSKAPVMGPNAHPRGTGNASPQCMACSGGCSTHARHSYEVYYYLKESVHSHTHTHTKHTQVPFLFADLLRTCCLAPLGSLQKPLRAFPLSAPNQRFIRWPCSRYCARGDLLHRARASH